MKKFSAVIERELEHVEQRLEGLQHRYGTGVEKERERLTRDWKGLRAALAAYRKHVN